MDAKYQKIILPGWENSQEESHSLSKVRKAENDGMLLKKEDRIVKTAVFSYGTENAFQQTE